MPKNVYEGRPNEDALEKQREKYIQQELDWFFTKEGMDFLSLALDDMAFRPDPSEKDPISRLVDKVREGLYEKIPSKKNVIDGVEFVEEFPKNIIKEQMVKRGIIDSDDLILINEMMDAKEEEEKSKQKDATLLESVRARLRSGGGMWRK